MLTLLYGVPCSPFVGGFIAQDTVVLRTWLFLGHGRILRLGHLEGTRARDLPSSDENCQDLARRSAGVPRPSTEVSKIQAQDPAYMPTPDWSARSTRPPLISMVTDPSSDGSGRHPSFWVGLGVNFFPGSCHALAATLPIPGRQSGGRCE
jgi:hypothetical protein